MSVFGFVGLHERRSSLLPFRSDAFLRRIRGAEEFPSGIFHDQAGKIILLINTYLSKIALRAAIPQLADREDFSKALIMFYLFSIRLILEITFLLPASHPLVTERKRFVSVLMVDFLHYELG
jgi:hypothetical protein